MSTFRLSRRAVLKGAGSIAIALPWLEIMERPRRAYAAGPALAQRFVAVYKPGGCVLDKWRPTGTETAPVLSPTLQPFEPVKDRLIVLSGLDMKSAVGEQVQAGIMAFLTGMPQLPPPSNLVAGPSIDQVLATGALADQPLPGGGHVTFNRPIASLQMAVRWGTGKGRGLLNATDALNFESAAPYKPITPALDPVKIWQTLFGTMRDNSPQRWNRSLLDFVDKRYVKLGARLGAADKKRLDEHLTSLRSIETRLSVGGKCGAPTLVDTSDYDPAAGLKLDIYGKDANGRFDLKTDAAIPKVGKLMMDMIVMAFACNLTAVATLQWADTNAQYTFPWLALPETHDFYQNSGGYRPVELQAIDTWYCTQHAYLLQEMAKVDMGGHSLLDESIVLFGTEDQNPATHVKTNMPFLLAGGGGGLRGGRALSYPSVSHNDLLVSILNLCGDPRKTFGDPKYCTGPLTGLT